MAEDFIKKTDPSSSIEVGEIQFEDLPDAQRLQNLRQEIAQQTTRPLDASLLQLEWILRTETHPVIQMLASEKRKYLIYEYFADKILEQYPALAEKAQTLQNSLSDVEANALQDGRQLRWTSQAASWQRFVENQVPLYFGYRADADGRRLVKNDPYMMQVVVEEMRGHRLRRRRQPINDHLSDLAEAAAKNALKYRFLPNFVDSYSLRTYELLKDGRLKKATPEACRDAERGGVRSGEWWRSLGLMPELVNADINQRFASLRENKKHQRQYRTWLTEQRQLAQAFLQEVLADERVRKDLDSPEFLQRPWPEIRQSLDEECWREVSHNSALRQLATADLHIFLSRRSDFVYQDIGLFLQAVSHYNARYFLFNYCRGQDLLLHRLVSAEAAAEVERVYEAL